MKIKFFGTRGPGSGFVPMAKEILQEGDKKEYMGV